MVISARRYLLTGGAGFIGAALTRRLVREGHHVRLLDDHSRSSTRGLGDVADEIEAVDGSVCDAETVADAVKGVDCVVHLAAINGTQHFYDMPERVLDVGVRGIVNVIDGCRAHGVTDLVVASSSEVYQTPATVPTDETAPLVIPDLDNPRYSYAASKMISEMMALWHGRKGFERVVVFRPHNVYGPDMGWEHVVPQFVLRAAKAVEAQPRGPVEFPIRGDGRQTRAFTYIEDCIDGIMVLLDKAEHLGVYHLGNPEEIAIAEVARRVLGWFGRDAAIQPGRPVAGETPRRCPDIGRIAALGFRPLVPFADGLPPTAEWYVENAHRRPRVA